MDNIKKITEWKLRHYCLNLDYQIDSMNLEAQTNQIIASFINNFLEKYNKDIENKIFILEYQDDLLSVITYRILKNLASLSKMNLFLYGKKSKTKKYLEKGEKFIPLSKIKKYIKNCGYKIVYISCFNPIYKVFASNKVFNKFPCDMLYPMKNFTPDEISMAQLFYHIGYIKYSKDITKRYNNGDILEIKNKIINFCNKMELSEEIKSFGYTWHTEKKIYVVFWENNFEIDKKIAQKVQDLNDMIFYMWYDSLEEPEIISKSYFPLYLKNKTNIPKLEYYNYNDLSIPKYLAERWGNEIIEVHWKDDKVIKRPYKYIDGKFVELEEEIFE